MSKIISQTLPAGQVEIIKSGLKLLLASIEILQSNNNQREDTDAYTMWDINTLLNMMDKTKVVVEVPFNVYENFTELYGMDFPLYNNIVNHNTKQREQL